MNTTTGFIGLGRLGGVLAQRLLHAGVTVVGYSKDGLPGLVQQGGIAAGSASEVARDSRIIIQCLPRSLRWRMGCMARTGC